MTIDPYKLIYLLGLLLGGLCASGVFGAFPFVIAMWAYLYQKRVGWAAVTLLSIPIGLGPIVGLLAIWGCWTPVIHSISTKRLLRILRGRNSRLRIQAAYQLAYLRDPQVIEPLIHTLLTPGDPSVRAAVAKALQLIGARGGKGRSQVNSRATRALVGCLDDFNPNVKEAAVWAAGKLRDVGFVPRLIPILKNRAIPIDAAIRRTAAVALSKIYWANCNSSNAKSTLQPITSLAKTGTIVGIDIEKDEIESREWVKDTAIVEGCRVEYGGHWEDATKIIKRKVECNMEYYLNRYRTEVDVVV